MFGLFLYQLQDTLIYLLPESFFFKKSCFIVVISAINFPLHKLIYPHIIMDTFVSEKKNIPVRYYNNKHDLHIN